MTPDQAGTTNPGALRAGRTIGMLRGSRVATGVAVACILVVSAAAAAAQDWAQWRGPERDGRATGFEAPAAWPETLQRRWSVEVGAGYATPLIVGDTLFAFARQGEEEVLLALDPATGEVRRRSAYPAPFDMSPATARHGPGPKSTPAFADGRIFVHGMTGSVSAFDADSGERLWHVPGTGVEPLYHTSMSPLVVDSAVIVHVGGHDDGALTAFDVASGDVVWTWEDDGPAYGSPMQFRLGGADQVVTFTQEHFIAVDSDSGALLWSRPFETPSTTTSQTPLLHGDLVIQNGRENGVTAFRATRNDDGWVTEDVWRTRDASFHMANPVVWNNLLFGLSHLRRGQYVAVDLDTGAVAWSSDPRQAENAAMAVAGDFVLSLEEDAELVVFEASREGLRELRRYEVADSATWAQPAWSGNRIFVKDVSRITLWTVGPS